MPSKYQRKLVITPRMDKVVNKYARENECTHAEALRELINEGVNKKWLTEKELQEYLNNGQ